MTFTHKNHSTVKRFIRFFYITHLAYIQGQMPFMYKEGTQNYIYGRQPSPYTTRYALF